MSSKYRIVAVVCVLALVIAGGWYTLFRPSRVRTVSADFATTDGIYPGNKVQVLGVPVGVVRSLRPQGPVVRVTMQLRPDIRIPAAAQAYIMSPALISDRFVELGPAYTGGPELPEGGLIPVQRTHSPIRWDHLMSSLDTIVRTLGPNGLNRDGDLGSVLHDAATAVDGKGPQVRAAIDNLARASDVVAGNRDQLAGLINNLDVLVRALATHRSTVESLSANVAQASKDYSSEQINLDRTIGQLSRVLTEVDTLIREHGGEITASTHNLAGTTSHIAAQRQHLSEVLTTLPLVFGNFSRAITEDERLRIRLDVSSNLSRFPATAKLCERIPVPLCSGPGLVNPIPLPPNLDPLRALSSPAGGGR